MESFSPVILPPERAPDILPPKKPKRNIFEGLKKPEAEAPKEAAPEKVVELPKVPERRKFASEIITLLKGETVESQKPSAETVAESPALPESRAEEVEPPVVISPEQVAVLNPVVEHAQEMGRHVLRLINKVKAKIKVADRQDSVAAPTDIEPLVEADADVRAAMEELVAPIVALEAETTAAVAAAPAHAENEPVSRGVELFTTPESTTFAAPAVEVAFGAGDVETVSHSTPTGGDMDHAGSLLEPLARAQEVASHATSVALEALSIKERLLENKVGIVRKVGVLAVGVATAGGFVYTWRRMRKIHKEQREIRKEHKKFEAEVRLQQTAEEKRLRALEQTRVAALPQAERQQYVQEVSTFAHGQAAEIRTVARVQEQARVEAQSPVSRAPQPVAVPRQPDAQVAQEQREIPVFSVPAEQKVEQPRPVEKLGKIKKIEEAVPEPSERFVRQPSEVTVERPQPTAGRQAERQASIETLPGEAGPTRRSQLDGGTSGAGGGFAGVGAQPGSDINSAQIPQTLAQQDHQYKDDIKKIMPKQYTQAWMLGLALAAGAIGVVLFLAGIF